MWYNRSVVKNEGGMDMAKSNIVEMKSFKEKRKSFFEEIKLKEEIKPKEEMEATGEIQVININQKRLKAKKTARKNSKEEQRRATRTRFLKKVGAVSAIIATSAVVAAGVASKAYDKYVDDRRSVTVEQALKEGKTPESLAISQETLEDIENMNETLGRGLTYEEMLEVARKLPIIQKQMLKEKIAMAMEVEAEDVTFLAPNDEDGVCVAIQGKGYFETKNLINQIQGRSVSKDIINYIEEIIEAQGMKEDFSANKVGIEEAKTFYQKAAKRMSQVAAWEIEADEKENIGVEKISQLELELDDDEERE